MKKLKSMLFGGMFMIALLIFSEGPVASQGLGGGGGEKWVCCQKEDKFCTDFLGGAWSDSIRVDAEVCP